MACLRLVTFLPLRPLLSVPFFRFFIARSTSLEAPFEYLRAILFLPKQTILAAAAIMIRPTLVTSVHKALFRTHVPRQRSNL